MAAAFPDARAHAGRDACLWASGRDAAQKGGIVVHRDRRIAQRMAVPGRVAVDAWAARDAGRSAAIPELHQEGGHDSQKAADRDFPWAMAEPERLLSRVSRRVQVLRRAQPPQGEQQKVASQPVLRVAQVQKAVAMRTLQALL